ncbi:MAG: 30S ribosomal protein S12 methylthiotransferase RimO, partial [Gammaproteobacteria bacterium]
TDVIVDDITEDQLICRSMWDAPEIDGQVFVDLVDGIEVGDIVPVLIDTSDEHDLWGKVAE